MERGTKCFPPPGAATAGRCGMRGMPQRGGDALDRAVKGPWQVWPFPAQRRGPGGSPHLCAGEPGSAGVLRGRAVAEAAVGLQIRAIPRRRGAF